MKKNRDKLLQKRYNRNISFREILRSYDGFENRLKAMEKKFIGNDSENNQSFHKRNLFKAT